MILVLQTGTDENLLELYSPGGNKELSKAWPTSKLLSEELPGKIEDALSTVGKEIGDISGIVAFKGPGSFTGLRIGITVLNTIADQLPCPIVGTSGDGWVVDGLDRLLSGEDDKIVLPEYGRDANITQPRK